MKISRSFITLAILASFVTAAAIPAFAAETTTVGSQAANWHGQAGSTFNGSMMRTGGGTMMGRGTMRPGVIGTVSAVSGNTITVSGRTGFGTSTPVTTFTIDASKATVMKNNATGSIANIAIGDTLYVQGTVSGSNVIATMIRDGVMMRGQRPTGGDNGGKGESSTGQQVPSIGGNGQPVVAGTISSISGSVLSVTNKSKVSYTVDASNAKIYSGTNSAATTISTLKVGDTVVIQGSVSGSAVTASSVIDQTIAAGTSGKSDHPGFFGSIGKFFMNIFGF